MAAVSAAGDEIVQFELNHYICGYHDYMDIWTPYIRETLSLHCEPSTSKDPHAVAMMSSEWAVIMKWLAMFQFFSAEYSTFFSKDIATMAAVKLLVKGSIAV